MVFLLGGKVVKFAEKNAASASKYLRNWIRGDNNNNNALESANNNSNNSNASRSPYPTKKAAAPTANTKSKSKAHKSAASSKKKAETKEKPISDGRGSRVNTYPKALDDALRALMAAKDGDVSAISREDLKKLAEEYKIIGNKSEPPFSVLRTRCRRKLAAFQTGKFTDAEDKIILANIPETGVPNYVYIGRLLNRSPAAIHQRYTNTLQTNLISGPFTDDEDAFILNAYTTARDAGEVVIWSGVARTMHRKPVSVAQRWRRTLMARYGITD